MAMVLKRTVSFHQQNVNRSESNMQCFQPLRVISPVLVSISRCFQTSLERSNVLSDSAWPFSSAPESTCWYGNAFRMLQDLTYGNVKLWNTWDLGADQREITCAAQIVMQLGRRLRRQPRPLHSTLGDLVQYSHSSSSYITTRHFILSYSSLLQWQYSLPQNMATNIQVSV
jgi:hypothetical protein